MTNTTRPHRRPPVGRAAVIGVHAGVTVGITALLVRGNTLPRTPWPWKFFHVLEVPADQATQTLAAYMAISRAGRTVVALHRYELTGTADYDAAEHVTKELLDVAKLADVRVRDYPATLGDQGLLEAGFYSRTTGLPDARLAARVAVQAAVTDLRLPDPGSTRSEYTHR